MTLVLLALLMLALFALATMGKVGSELAATGVYETQARQIALLGLDTALGELQRRAEPDAIFTGMAGITGIPPGAGNPARNWCGVWDGAGQFQGWLASGPSGATVPNLAGVDSLAMLANGALGADGTDKEHVRVLRVPVTLTTRAGTPGQQGALAWWVGDEGVKLSAVVPDAEAPVPGQKHAVNELITALSPTDPDLARVETFSQLAYATSPVLTPGQLQANLHSLGRTHYGWSGSARQAGLLNVNTTSHRFWRGVGATYDRLRPGAPLGISLTTFANRLRDNLAAASGSGKAPGGPFQSVEAFLGSDLLAGALAGSSVTPADFGDALRPWLAVRSDTFRIRAYGEAVNPADSSRTEAMAWCEAMVQRTKDNPTAPAGRFVVVYFRWLGPDDI
ncbi:MAG TPA: hypothetical protein VG734_15315 [Lacunisphaera sp.]|nr:hypothetical protein [Lacunisphaera sp.]